MSDADLPSDIDFLVTHLAQAFRGGAIARAELKPCPAPPLHTDKCDASRSMQTNMTYLRRFGAYYGWILADEMDCPPAPRVIQAGLCQLEALLGRKGTNSAHTNGAGAS